MSQQHLDRLTAIDASFLHQEGPASHMHVGALALITKTHHALIDGVAGVDIAQVIFDLGPVPTEVPHPDEPWRAHPEPSTAEILGAGALGLVRTAARTAATAAVVASRPR